MVQFRHKQGGKSLNLFVVKDPKTPLAAQLTGQDTRLVTVRGHQGLLLTGSVTQHTPRLMWDEPPHLRIEISADDTISDEQLLRAAEQLVPLTDTQWARYGAPHSVLHTDDPPANLRPR